MDRIGAHTHGTFASDHRPRLEVSEATLGHSMPLRLFKVVGTREFHSFFGSCCPSTSVRAERLGQGSDFQAGMLRVVLHVVMNATPYQEKGSDDLKRGR